MRRTARTSSRRKLTRYKNQLITLFEELRTLSTYARNFVGMNDFREYNTKARITHLPSLMVRSSTVTYAASLYAYETRTPR